MAQEHLVKKLSLHKQIYVKKSTEHFFEDDMKEILNDEHMHCEEVERILKLEPKDRSTQNINSLKYYFADNQYFREQAEMYEDKTMQYLYR